MRNLALMWVLAGVVSVTAVQANLDPPFSPPPPPQPWKSGETTVTLSQDGTLTVSGNGAMADYDTLGNQWRRYNGEIIRLVIEDGVTRIGNGAFMCCDDLTSVSIPSSVTSIGRNAFQDCSGLTSITIPNSVTSVGEFAFANNTGLTSITIPNRMKTTGEFTFYYCTSLTTITIPNSVDTIGSGVFAGCHSVTSIIVRNSSPPYVGDAILAQDINKKSNTHNKILSWHFDMNSVCLYVPLTSIPAYRFADGWKEFKCVKPIEPYGVWLVCGILLALLLSATVFVIIRKSRINQRKERRK